LLMLAGPKPASPSLNFRIPVWVATDTVLRRSVVIHHGERAGGVIRREGEIVRGAGYPRACPQRRAAAGWRVPCLGSLDRPAARFTAAFRIACVVLRILLSVRPLVPSSAAASAGASAASADAAGVSGVSAGFSAALPGVSPDGCAACCVCATLFGVSADCVCATANPIPSADPLPTAP